MLAEARNGNLTAWARALTAHRVHVARVAAGLETFEDASVDVEVGGVLEAEFAFDVHALRQEWLAAHKE